MNFILKNARLSVMAVVIALCFSACDSDEDDVMVVDPGNGEGAETTTIADFASNNDNYSSLAAALEVTGLSATLDGDANYTVFAPDNDAFAAFLDANDFESLDEVPVEVLTQVLLNHVQAGVIKAADLSTGYIQSLSTAGPEGKNLSLYINTENGVKLNGVSNVTTADVEVDNGVIHAVDAVIGLPNITTFALADPTFEILVQALTREDSYTFVETLMLSDSPAPFTVFAPTNDAFVNLLDELDLDSLADIDAETLAAVLSYHVVTENNVTSDELSDGMSVATFQGESFTINLGDNAVITDVNNRTSTIIAVDVQATNGVIHAIDTVILPTL
ncbi:fasciclin domain-containing protein [Christiangramia salexigens]|uniref:Fasciclin n=1 Tax=Christiangramia salexigens TaxID=1913577 RepID=A0A1L3J480_9FLAO|nr:fasciclin domain-containing protein [Christiangramia salexigens]APG59935.1 fasciclin [Christiangramia salexigens]